MRVKVEILKEEGVPDGGMIETHGKRGETFNIMRSDSVSSGEAQTFLVPPNGRLIINAPRATENPVYDANQMASVYPSSQRNSDIEADRPMPADVIATKERELEELKRQENERKERERIAAEETNNAIESQRQAVTGSQTATTPTTIRTPPQGGQPLSGQTTRTPQTPVTNKTPSSTTIDTSKAPNPSPGTQSPNPATTQSGGNTEKK